MKKLFLEPFIVYVGFALFLCALPFSIYCFLWGISDGIYAAIFVLGAIAADAFFLVTTLWPRADYIIVADAYAEWHCFLRRKRRVYYEECRYIAVETFNKESHGSIVRGDEFAMIYLSLDPYPEELRGKINRLRCTDRVIKFRYSDKLARAVLERAPQEKTRLLYSFYNQMQNYDSRMKRQRKQRKKKKRKS